MKNYYLFTYLFVQEGRVGGPWKLGLLKEKILLGVRERERGKRREKGREFIRIFGETCGSRGSSRHFEGHQSSLVFLINSSIFLSSPNFQNMHTILFFISLFHVYFSSSISCIHSCWRVNFALPSLFQG